MLYPGNEGLIDLTTFAANGGAAVPDVESGSISNCLANMGSSFERAITVFFTQIGEFAARRPMFVLIPGILITIGLSFGIYFLKITTDPVELWASPNSRSRVEKEYFDSHFQPFYRTEQVIVTAVGLGNVYHNTTDGEIEFGPVFNLEFLESLLELQNMITYEVRILDI
jgi:Niemann-Pick C1 protein